MSIDNHNRQRGNDEADASLLVEGENSAEEVDVVIGAVESNEADHKAADQLDAALGIKTKEPGTALLFGFWRNLSFLVDARGDMHSFGITVAHSADRPESITHSTRVRPAVGGPPPYGANAALNQSLSSQYGGGATEMAGRRLAIRIASAARLMTPRRPAHGAGGRRERTRTARCV